MEATRLSSLSLSLIIWLEIWAFWKRQWNCWSLDWKKNTDWPKDFINRRIVNKLILKKSTLMKRRTWSFCPCITGLMDTLGPNYVKDKSRLFLDSSKRSIKAFFLYHKSHCASVAVGHPMHLKERYKYLVLSLKIVSYVDHDWTTRSGLNVIYKIFGITGGCTKLPSFIHDWDGWNKAASRKEEWQNRPHL